MREPGRMPDDGGEGTPRKLPRNTAAASAADLDG